MIAILATNRFILRIEYSSEEQCKRKFPLQRRSKQAESDRVKYWETIADKLSKAGWSWGYVSAVDREGQTIWIVDANRDDGKRYVIRSDELLSAFLELERITHRLAVYAVLDDGKSGR